MLLCNITICFNVERKNGYEYYGWAAARCMTFRFEPNVYFIGFAVDYFSHDENYKIMLYQEYNVDYIFPSINENTFRNFEYTINHDLLIHGGEIVGKAKVEDWVFVEDSD
jgi:hypothetical protein